MDKFHRAPLVATFLMKRYSVMVRDPFLYSSTDFLYGTKFQPFKEIPWPPRAIPGVFETERKRGRNARSGAAFCIN